MSGFWAEGSLGEELIQSVYSLLDFNDRCFGCDDKFISSFVEVAPVRMKHSHKNCTRAIKLTLRFI